MILTISGNLKRFVGFQKYLEIPATTVSEAVDELVARYPDLGPVLLDSGGELRRSNRLFLNDEPLDHLSSPVGDDDELAILTAIAGG